MLLELEIYILLLVKNAWSRWWNSMPLLTVVGFFYGILFDMKAYIFSITALVTIDIITGIMASLHRGEKFRSKKLLWGLLDRFILYSFLFVTTIMLDTILRDTIDYGRSYIAIFTCTIIGFYEASSCIENLVNRFPDYTFLQKIGKALNLLEKQYEDSTVNKVADIIKSTGEKK